MEVLFPLSSVWELFLKIFILFIFRERETEGEREGEKHQCVVASCATPPGDMARDLGMCPDWESNWRPFSSQAGTQSTELHQPGLEFSSSVSQELLYRSFFLLKHLDKKKFIHAILPIERVWIPLFFVTNSLCQKTVRIIVSGIRLDRTFLREPIYKNIRDGSQLYMILQWLLEAVEANLLLDNLE